MILIRTCWYLSALFLTMLCLASFICVVPGSEINMAAVMATLLLLGVGCAIFAIFLKRLFRKNPAAFIFKSKTIAGVFIGLAILLTLVLVIGFLP